MGGVGSLVGQLRAALVKTCGAMVYNVSAIGAHAPLTNHAVAAWACHDKPQLLAGGLFIEGNRCRAQNKIAGLSPRWPV